MQIIRILIPAIAVFAFGFVSATLSQDLDSAGAPHHYSLAEVAAAHYGITVGFVVTTWDDIPLIPYPTGFFEDAEPFRPTSLTLPNALRVAPGQELERLENPAPFCLW